MYDEYSPKWSGGCSLKFFRGPADLASIRLGACAGAKRLRSADELMGQVQPAAKRAVRQEKFLSPVAESTLISYQFNKISPEDLLEAKFSGLYKPNRFLWVKGHGEVSLLLSGPVSVGGLLPQEAGVRLPQICQDRKFIRHPQISDQILKYHYQLLLSILMLESFDLLAAAF
jgi:hypothetical protein